jgi:hypothetical protein
MKVKVWTTLPFLPDFEVRSSRTLRNNNLFYIHQTPSFILTAKYAPRSVSLFTDAVIGKSNSLWNDEIKKLLKNQLGQYTKLRYQDLITNIPYWIKESPVSNGVLSTWTECKTQEFKTKIFYINRVEKGKDKRTMVILSKVRPNHKPD